MLSAERLQKILEYIKNNQSATVKELANKFKASKSTIRRDLGKLDKKNLVQRTHGGAIANLSTTYEKNADEKRLIMRKEKHHIGKLAAKHILDGESILLDSGSTTLEVSKNLQSKTNVTVITHDIRIALETKLGVNSSLVVTGGTRREGFEVLVGNRPEEFIQKLTVDKAFLGADAIDINKGITNATFSEVPIKQKIINSAKKVILVADHTKFNKKALVKVNHLDEIDKIITDPKIDREIAENIKKTGVEIIT